LEFYENLQTKDKDGKWDTISKLFKPIIEADAVSKFSIIEYMSGGDGNEAVQYVLISVAPTLEVTLLENLWKIINKN